MRLSEYVRHLTRCIVDTRSVAKIEDSFVTGMPVLPLFRPKKNEITDYCALTTRTWERVNAFFKCPFCPFLFVARPSAPSGFRIIRPVNHDAMLVGWTLPEMDEFGRSNGLTVKGYKASIVLKETFKRDFPVSTISVFNLCPFGFLADLCK